MSTERNILFAETLKLLSTSDASGRLLITFANSFESDQNVWPDQDRHCLAQHSGDIQEFLFGKVSFEKKTAKNSKKTAVDKKK